MHWLKTTDLLQNRMIYIKKNKIGLPWFKGAKMSPGNENPSSQAKSRQLQQGHTHQSASLISSTSKYITL